MTKLISYVIFIVRDAARWTWRTFSTTLLDVNRVMATVSTHHLETTWYIYVSMYGILLFVQKENTNWAILYLCVRGYWICLFLRIWYLILELFRQCGIFCLSSEFFIYNFQTSSTDPNSILYISHHRLFKPMTIHGNGNEKEYRYFLPVFIIFLPRVLSTMTISYCINLLGLWFHLIQR